MPHCFSANYTDELLLVFLFYLYQFGEQGNFTCHSGT